MTGGNFLLKSNLLFRDSRALQNGYRNGGSMYTQNNSINIDDCIPEA